MPFYTVKAGALEYLKAENIAVPHGFTTRMGGVSKGCWESLNFSVSRGDSVQNVAENHRILAAAMGYSLDNLVLANQIHTDIVWHVTEKDCLGSIFHRDYPACDGLVTNTKGVALMVFTADCTPILLHDPVTGAVGAVHAGWRGTAAGIVAKAVKKMAAAFGSCPENIHAAIGPNIGQCCFETDGDVPEAMLSALGEDAMPYIHPEGEEKFKVDLKGLNTLWLRRSGVKTIEISDACTACAPDRFWSHRKTGGKRGSQVGVIVCRGERE